eukprot:scaffold6279_cov228-Isochrysis_galbana.AAC.4
MGQLQRQGVALRILALQREPRQHAHHGRGWIAARISEPHLCRGRGESKAQCGALSRAPALQPRSAHRDGKLDGGDGTHHPPDNDGKELSTHEQRAPAQARADVDGCCSAEQRKQRQGRRKRVPAGGVAKRVDGVRKVGCAIARVGGKCIALERHDPSQLEGFA